MWLLLQREWVGGDCIPPPDCDWVIRGRSESVMTLWYCRWDIFSGEMNYISPVFPQHSTESLHLIWPWSNFISYGSLLSPVRYPYRISGKCWHQILSLVTSIKSYFLFLSQFLLPFNQKLPNWNMRFPSLSSTRHIRPKLCAHQELCRRIPIGKGSWSVC